MQNLAFIFFRFYNVVIVILPIFAPTNALKHDFMSKLRIKELCKMRGLTLRDLALKVGISQNSISCIVSGKQKPSFDTLEKLAECLSVEIPELFTTSAITAFCPHCGKPLKILIQKYEVTK